MNKSEAAWSSDRQNGFENQEEEDQGEARRRRRRRRRRAPGDDGAENCCGGFQGGQRRRCRQDLNRGFPAWSRHRRRHFLLVWTDPKTNDKISKCATSNLQRQSRGLPSNQKGNLCRRSFRRWRYLRDRGLLRKTPIGSPFDRGS